MRPLLGVDLGGTKLLAVVADAEGRVLDRVQLPSERGLTPDGALDRLDEVWAEMRRRGHRLAAAGVGFPGLVDPRRGIVRSSVILEGGWKDEPLRERLAGRLGVPVGLDNDVNNAARAELWVRRDPRVSFLFLTVGTGIGGAVVLDGAIWAGAHGLAGEIGHVRVAADGPTCSCGRRGCIGSLAGGAAIEQELGLAPGGLREQVQRRDPAALAAVYRAAEQVGSGVADALNLLDLPLVVLGGGLAELRADFVGRVERAARAQAFPEIAGDCRFEPARAGYDAGALGGALLARDVAREAQPSGQPAARASSAS